MPMLRGASNFIWMRWLRCRSWVHFGTFLEKQKYASFAKPDLDKTDRENLLPFQPWPRGSSMENGREGQRCGLGHHLLLDGFKGAYDAAAILSNDSDLIEPVRMVKAELGLPIGLLSPVQNPTPQLRAAASFLRRDNGRACPCLCNVVLVLDHVRSTDSMRRQRLPNVRRPGR
jgi:hypothetical protein